MVAAQQQHSTAIAKSNNAADAGYPCLLFQGTSKGGLPMIDDSMGQIKCKPGSLDLVLDLQQVLAAVLRK
jgi:hypothetical protein